MYEVNEVIKLSGISKSKGIAIAVVAILDPILGVSGISSDLLQAGIKSIQSFANPRDYPEVIIICKEWFEGFSQRIAGINTIGVVAESEKDFADAEINIPCIYGVKELFKNAVKDVIAIIDADNGEIILDPDTATIIFYQQKIEELKPVKQFTLEEDYLPVPTKSGNKIFIFSLADCKDDIDNSLDTLPQGLLLTCKDNKFREYALQRSAGNKVWMLIDTIDKELIKILFRYSAPDQVKLVVEEKDFVQALLDLTVLTEDICVLEGDEILAPSLAINYPLECIDKIVSDPAISVYIDIENENIDGNIIKKVIDSRHVGMDVMVYLDDLEIMEELYSAGLRFFAVRPELIIKAKEKAASLV